MLRISALLYAGLLAGAAVFPSAHATAPTNPPPLSAFFEHASYSGAQLSPDGRLVAIKATSKSGRVRLAVVDNASRKTTVVAAFEDADIGRYVWVNDHRLAFNVTDQNVAQGDLRFGPGLWAVNADGSELRQLVRRDSEYNDVISRTGNSKLLPWTTNLMDAVGNADSDDVFVTQYEFAATYELSQISLLRLNTVTGKTRAYSRPLETFGWLVDRQGVPRIAIAYRDNQQVIYYHEHEDDPWTQLASFQQYPAPQGAFEPLFFAPDGTLYVKAALNGAATLFTYDIAAHKLSDKPVLSTPGYDFRGHLVFDHKHVQGITYEVDAKGTYWVDASMQAVQAEVDALLPGTINQIDTPLRPSAPWVLVKSGSDRQPLTYRLYNTETKSLSLLGSSHPAIAAQQMAPKTMVRYKARDGMEIPAYVTIPERNGGKNLPMVVLVHGGPWLRGGSWDWEAQSQFLASRGYVVLEPDYRGSTGYGWQHFHAGWKQWGLKMQDDVADGARWAIAQGIADPKRICIAGASYGGYATLMGLINDPGLYQCGIAWAGVSDIAMLKNGHWTGDSDLGDSYKQYGMPVMVGDPVKDAAQLNATSPLAQAARLKQPLLLAHGGADSRVPVVHSSAFRDAVGKTNPHVEWVLYPEEGHGWYLTKNNLDFWQRVETFLDQYIGAPK